MAVRGRWPPFGSKDFSHPSLLSTAKQVASAGTWPPVAHERRAKLRPQLPRRCARLASLAVTGVNSTTHQIEKGVLGGPVRPEHADDLSHAARRKP